MSKIAFVASGGGAKGIRQVAFLDILINQHGIKPDYFIGTSVGAINSVGYAYLGLDKLKDFWFGLKSKSDILSFNWAFMFKDGLNSMKPLRKKLESIPWVLPYCESVVSYVDQNLGSLHYAYNTKETRADFLKYVEASSSIPGIMQPVDGHLVDGGVREIVPLQRAIKDGATEIYILLANPLTQNSTDEYDSSKGGNFLKFLKHAYRNIDGIMEHEVYVNDVNKMYECCRNNKKIKFTVMALDEKSLLSTTEFDPKKMREEYNRSLKVVPRVIK